MKKLILLAVLFLPFPVHAIVFVSSNTLHFDENDAQLIAVIPLSDVVAGTAPVTVDCGTPTIVSPGIPVVSTGPVIMRSPTTSDCYKIPYVNPNGSCGPTMWTVCPK